MKTNNAGPFIEQIRAEAQKYRPCELSSMTGLSRPTISNWRLGRSQLSSDKLGAVADAIGLEVRVRKGRGK